MKKILIDGRPIRDPLSGVAETVFNLAHSLENILDVTIYLQSNCFRNHVLDNVFIKNKFVSNKYKFLENVLIELGLNNNDFNFKNGIIHETYFARSPIKKLSNSVISTIHDLIPLDFPEWFSKTNAFFSKRNFYRQMNQSDFIVFPSKFTADRAFNYFDKEVNYSIIPWGISNEIRKFFSTYSPNFKNPYFLVLGNIEPRKNIPFIAKAVQLFNEANNEKIKLVVAGKQVFNSKAIIEETMVVNQNTEFVGFVSNDTKIKLLQECASVIYASRYEGFGLPVLEASIIGCPVIVSRNSSLVEVSPSEEFLFDNKLESLLDRLNNLCFKNISSVISKKKILDIYKHTSWDSCAKKYSDIYKKL